MCDGPELDGQDCISQGSDAGDLACAGDCLAFDTSACDDDQGGGGCALAPPAGPRAPWLALVLLWWFLGRRQA